MNEPKRLLEEASEGEQELLRSAKLDDWTPARVRGHLSRLGVAASSLGAAGAASKAAAAKTASMVPASQGASHASAMLTASKLKLVVGSLVAVGGVATGAAVLTISPSEPSPTVTPPAQPKAVEHAKPANSAAVVTVETKQVEHSVPVASVEPPPKPNVHESNTHQPGAAKANDLSAELSAIKQAQLALRSGTPAEALERIARYRAEFPDGKMKLEASVIEIEALFASGQKSQARARAEALLERQPSGPYARRLSSLLQKD